MIDIKELPEVVRVSYADHARNAADELVSPEEAGRLAADACRLEPLQKIQVALDQIVGHAAAHRRGDPLAAGGDFHGYFTAEMAGLEHYRNVLLCAGEAAVDMIDEMRYRVNMLESAMSHEPDEPKLTVTGEPHPLEQGGYDPSADPQKSPETTDVESLKEGKTTTAQAEAIGRADAEKAKENEPLAVDPVPVDADQVPAPVQPPPTVVVDADDLPSVEVEPGPTPEPKKSKKK